MAAGGGEGNLPDLPEDNHGDFPGEADHWMDGDGMNEVRETEAKSKSHPSKGQKQTGQLSDDLSDHQDMLNAFGLRGGNRLHRSPPKGRGQPVAQTSAKKPPTKKSKLTA